MLTPYAQLGLSLPVDRLGTLVSPSEVVAWNLTAQIADGARPNVAYSGLTLDPSGQWLIQQAKYVPIDCDETQWTVGGGDTGTYSHGTKASTNKKQLYQNNGSNTVQSSISLNTRHGADVFGGFSVGLWRNAPSSPLASYDAAHYSWYLYLNNGTPAGLMQLRVAIELGNPIRLDGSDDGGATWTKIDEATALGDSESYLSQNKRDISIDVIPLFDQSYYQSSVAFAISDNPPDCVIVNLNNGDALLTYRQVGGTFPAGNIAVTCLGGQWGLNYAKRQYLPIASATLPTQTYPRPFSTTPIGRVTGYVPYGATWEIDPLFPSGSAGYNQVSATVTVTAPPQNIDGTTGFSTSTVALNQAQLEFPPVFNGPYNGAEEHLFDLNRIVGFEEVHEFDQTNFLRRSKLKVILRNDDLLLSPGQLYLSARAAQFSRGWIDTSNGYNDVTLGITGVTTFDDAARDTFTWNWDSKLPYVTIEISDRFIVDQPIGWMLPMDGQCHYYAQRQCAYRLGIQDSQMDFPFCERNSNCNHYHLPSGTTYEPLFQPHPAQSVVSFMLLIRKMSGDYDPLGSGAILPMYLMFSTGGYLEYFPAPIGIMQAFSGGGNLQIGKTYSAVETFDALGVPQLSQVTKSLQSSASLSNIRTAITLEGLSPTDGSIITGWLNNTTLDGSPYANPYAPGYIGIQRPYVDINKLYSSPDAVAQALAVAAYQLSFPSIKTSFTSLLQSGCFPVTGNFGNPVIGVQDFATQGNTAPIPYYPYAVVNRYGQQGQQLEMESNVYCRLLGEAG